MINKILNFARNNQFIQNLTINIMTSIPQTITINLSIIEILKKAFYYCDLESIEGSYFEFGVFKGTSMYAALNAYNKINKNNIDRNFYGFDSFDHGFKYFDSKDKHSFFKEGDFIYPFEKVQKRLKKFNNLKLIKGYFEETLSKETSQNIIKSEKCAIAFIDCDLLNPAHLSLSYLKPILQLGSILIIDDFWLIKDKVIMELTVL